MSAVLPFRQPQPDQVAKIISLPQRTLQPAPPVNKHMRGFPRRLQIPDDQQA
jgi:hypothetical protein